MPKQKPKHNLQSGFASVLLVVGFAVLGTVLVLNITLIKSVCQDNWFARLFKINDLCKQGSSKTKQALSLNGRELSISDGSSVVLPDFNGLEKRVDDISNNQAQSSTQQNYYSDYYSPSASACSLGQASQYNGLSFVCVNAGGSLNDAYNFGGIANGRIISTTSNNQPIRIINTYGGGTFGYNPSLEIVGDGSPGNPANSGIVFAKISLSGYSDLPAMFYSGNTNDLIGGGTFGLSAYNNDLGNESLNFGLVDQLNLLDIVQLSRSGVVVGIGGSYVDDGNGGVISMNTGNGGSNSGNGGDFSINLGGGYGATSGDGGSFRVYAGNSSNGSGGDITFQTGSGLTRNGVITFNIYGSESARLDSNGDFGIGNNSPSYSLHVGSSTTASGTTVARFENAGGACDITPNVAGGVTCTSDARMKKDISELTSSLEQIGAINVVQYRYNAEAESSGLHTGFIAQELEKTLPDLVQTDKNGIKSVSYAGLTPYLVKATQEQNVQFSDMSIKLTDLKDQFEQLNIKVDNMSSEMGKLIQNFAQLQQDYIDYKTSTDARINHLEEQLNGLKVQANQPKN